MTSTSARRTLTMRLGRTSRSCGFWVPRASASTSTRSPPTASTSALRSVVVVTTGILDAASAGTARRPIPSKSRRKSGLSMRASVRMGIIVSSSSLERMRRVGAHDERGLEEDLIHLPGAPAVVGEAVPVGPLGVLVAEAEAEELRRHEREVRSDRPLTPAHDRVLGPVIAEARGPAGELTGAHRLHPPAHLPAPPVPA